MSAPGPISSANSIMRCQTAFDLEVTLVKFLTKLFDHARLDNPTVNLAQPDTVGYDPTERAQTLVAKVPPQIVRGRIPRTVTGEIVLDRLPDYPAVVVQSVSAKMTNTPAVDAGNMVTTKILFVAYDENPDSQGYQDALNMVEAAAIALMQFGPPGLDQAYPMQMPLTWNIVDPESSFPHYLAELTCDWKLTVPEPAAYDWYGQGFAIPVPGENLELRTSSAA